MRGVKEDSTQIKIRTDLEISVERKIIDLYQELVALNIIHNDCIHGDRRVKKNIKLEKQLRKYLGENNQ